MDPHGVWSRAARRPDGSSDVLMVTHSRPHYTALSLQRLLERSDPSMRIWLWHNGCDEQTLDVVQRYRSGLYRFIHSVENQGLREPTNWLFENATGTYLGKVDDDCIIPEDWGTELRNAHLAEPRFGVIGCWRFQEEDFIPELAATKIMQFSSGCRLLVNMWVEGSGYLMKRACVARFGSIREGASFTDYCIRIGRAGWVNGWLYPFLHQEHMDDPRSAHSAMHSDADIRHAPPLSARRNGVQCLEDWVSQLRASARLVQGAPIDPRYWSPLRRRMRRLLARSRSMLPFPRQGSL